MRAPSLAPARYVFARLEERSRTRDVAVVVSFLEIYCDNVRDLAKAYLDKTARVARARVCV